MPGRSASCTSPLSPHEQVLVKRLSGHVRHLSVWLGERNEREIESLHEAADYIEEQFLSTGVGVVRREKVVIYTPLGSRVEADNVVLELPGSNGGADEIFVIGAHYDTVFGSPGANDNASGVAALLEIAHVLAQSKRRRTVRLVAFCNEEHPNMEAELMGSYSYAASCKRKKEKIIGMWSLETIGYFTDAPGSQHYPAPLNKLFPSVGNFIAFVGNYESRHWVHESISRFRDVATVPSEGIAAPGKFVDIDRSDHWGFWKAGYPALMITDTANFRYPWYHSSQDTHEKVSYENLARVVRGLAQAAFCISRM